MSDSADRLLVTITAPHQTWYLGSEPMSIEWADGTGPIQVFPGVEGLREIETTIDLFGGDSSAALSSARIEVVLPDAFNSAAGEALYYGLTAARVEIATIRDGQDYARRIVVLDGARVVGLSPGRGDEKTEIMVETSNPEAGASAVDPDRDVGTTYGIVTGYPDLAGRQFPVILGACYGVPLLRVGEEQVAARHSGIVAGHALAADVSYGDLTIYTDGVITTLTGGTLESGADPDGSPVAWIECGTAEMTEDTGTDPAPYAADFPRGGIPSVRDPTRAARSAGDVIEWLLSNAGVVVDVVAQRRATSLLGDWEIGVYLDRYDDLLAVLRDRVMPFVPVVERSGPAGAWIQYADPRRGPAEFEVTLGQHLLSPIGKVQYTRIDAVRNSFFMEYAYSSVSAGYTASVTLGAADLEMCRYSQQLYGVRADEPMRCSITAHAGTARRMLQARAERLALPRMVAEYAVDSSMRDTLREGMVGYLTDAERGWAARRCVIRQWAPMGSPSRAVFELVSRPPVEHL